MKKILAVVTMLFVPAAFAAEPSPASNREPDYMATEFVWTSSESKEPDTMATDFLWLPAQGARE
jgi:hypothetical protein